MLEGVRRTIIELGIEEMKCLTNASRLLCGIYYFIRMDLLVICFPFDLDRFLELHLDFLSVLVERNYLIVQVPLDSTSLTQ